MRQKPRPPAILQPFRIFRVKLDIYLVTVQPGIRIGLRSLVLAGHCSPDTGPAVLLQTLSDGDEAPSPLLSLPKRHWLRKGPCTSLRGSARFLRVCSAGVCRAFPIPRGLSAAPAPGGLHPRLCCCSPHLSPSPHPYWLGYVHSVCRRAGRGAYTHGLQVIYTLCIYIYIQHIYIYLFTFIYILYRTFTFYQKQFCDFMYGLSPEILTPGQMKD